MRTPIPEKFVEIISRNNGLNLYLESLLEDKPYTQRSWLYSGYKGSPKVNANKVLDDWLAQLSVLETGTDFEQKVFQFDISQKEKYGPQGGHAPMEELLNDIVMPSFNPPEWSLNPAAFKTYEWDSAVRTVTAKLQHAGVHDLYPRSYSKVVDDMRARDTLISNSGWPDFTRRNLPSVKSAAINAAQDGSWRDYPAILLFRRYNGKTRQVWMFPMATNIVEGSWFQPLTDAIMQSDLADEFFAPWKGFEAVRKNVSEAYYPTRGVYSAIAASDFSSTDAHFQLAASKEVLKVLTKLFKPQFADALTESVLHMHKIPLIISPTEMLVGDHGVASGSNWTNFIETIFDMIFAEYVCNMVTEKYRLPHLSSEAKNTNPTFMFDVWALYAIGDDEAWRITLGLNGEQPLTNEQKEALDNFPAFLEELGLSVGQQIKAEKTMCELNAVKSLQRLFQRGYTTQPEQYEGELRAVYSTIRALKSSIYPERAHYDKGWDLDMFAARQFMILENCVDHPLFEEFVKFICKGMPYLVQFARKTDKQLDSITRKSKSIPGLNPTYNQEKRDSSLAAFRSVLVARNL